MAFTTEVAGVTYHFIWQNDTMVLLKQERVKE